MKLKHVKIYGFKTFADRTEFEMDGNLIAVVGPNGCGKSNIVDAIMWALGEPSPKNLRAHNSADIIFAGSSLRKPLGFAEVTLTFDNSEGRLPIDTTDVVVSRRVDRSGESHYAINGRACRQKDVYELFADSGLGRTGYAIVSQSDIDAALSASAEERRTWLDEAAGVQRYRSRKNEALKRLDSALVHLQRVNDVIQEIELQREPLREQAEAARTYKGLVSSLREIESGLLIVEAVEAKEQVRVLGANVSEKRREAEEARKAAQKAESLSDEASSALLGIEKSLDAKTTEYHAASSNLERAVARVALAKQRLESLDELDANRDAEAQAASERIERAKKALELAERELTSATEAVDMLVQVLSGSDEMAQRLQQKLAQAESALAQARLASVDRIHREARITHLRERRSAIDRELEGAEAALPQLQQGVQDGEAKLQAERASLDAARHRLAEARESLASLQDAAKGLEGRRRTLLAEQAGLEGKASALRATLEAGEGMPAGVRAILAAHSEGALEGDFIPVSAAIHVESTLTKAIEAALGPSAGDLITSRIDLAREAIEYLKSEGAGRATFLPLDTLRQRERPEGLTRLAARPGVLGIAADLVGCDPVHKPAVEFLLGSVLIVEDSKVAASLARETGYRSIATLDGELLRAGGSLTGGSYRREVAGPIQRASELEETHARLTELAEALQAIHQESERLSASASELSGDEAKALKEVSEFEVSVAEIVQWLTALREELSATDRAIERLRAERNQIESELAVSHGDDAATEATVQHAETERNELLSLVAAKSADADQARRALADARERKDAAQARVNLARADYEDATAYTQTRSQRLENLGQERERQLAAIQQSEADRANCEEAVAWVTKELEELRNQRQTLEEQRSAMLLQARQLHERARELDDASYRDDILRARSETKLASVLARLLEEYNVSEEEAEQLAPTVELPDDAPKIAGRLRREIRSLGDVNIGAIEAYDILSERYETLTTQREDILESKAELDRTISELDRLTRGAFTKTFDEVNEAFREMFARLFGGGDAVLRLTDPERILETGVEIEVQVPGKAKQRLELLSGGERALSACAFLFALFKVKPSPLSVLDELDAPLDGRNVERYVDLLRDFAAENQFIVITHNPTTIAAAPIWFGVTMQEPGVSTVIPYRAAEHVPSSNGKRATVL
ncbi:MAG: Chromosome partition protein Smc [Fimbriimonadales bacterium]|nr:Chromosome partition protein Smc [Fimbriimonadales bacterium]